MKRQHGPHLFGYGFPRPLTNEELLWFGVIFVGSMFAGLAGAVIVRVLR
jgi:hypothetical protein